VTPPHQNHTPQLRTAINLRLEISIMSGRLLRLSNEAPYSDDPESLELELGPFGAQCSDCDGSGDSDGEQDRKIETGFLQNNAQEGGYCLKCLKCRADETSGAGGNIADKFCGRTHFMGRRIRIRLERPWRYPDSNRQCLVTEVYHAPFPAQST
jgi:hypothetical protein